MRKLISLLVCLFLLSGGVLAQSEMGYIGSLSGAISKKFTKKFEMSLEEELRLRTNYGVFDLLGTTIDASYNLVPKLLKVGADFTYRYKLNDDLYYQHRYRYSVYGRIKYPVGIFDLSLRLKYQSTYRQEYYKSYKWNPKNYLRAKLELEYSYQGSRWSPSLSCETFYQLNNPEGNIIDGLRYQLGADYRLDRATSIGVFVRFDQEIQVEKPINVLMLGIQYHFRL